MSRPVPLLVALAALASLHGGCGAPQPTRSGGGAGAGGMELRMRGGEAEFLSKVKSHLAAGGELGRGGTSRWDGRPELHEAAEKGYARAVAFLLERGADPSAVDRSGMTAVHVAAWERHTDVLQLLVAGGADVNAG
ncbi:MAG: ankyrin repeat domain-containing protein, partial [Planctomycetota bacterium]